MSYQQPYQYYTPYQAPYTSFHNIAEYSQPVYSPLQPQSQPIYPQYVSVEGFANSYVYPYAPPSTASSINNYPSVQKVVSSRQMAPMAETKNEEVVKGTSRVEYVPYERKVIEYQDKERIERRPVVRKVIEYREQKVVEQIPREVVMQDFYAVQRRVEYKKEIIPQRKIEMRSVEKKIKRYEYVPVEKQIVHYPDNVDLETAKGQSRVILQKQGVIVKPDAEFKKLSGDLLYNYSSKPQNKDNPVGYVDEGHFRTFSNAPTLPDDPLHHEVYKSNYPAQFSGSRVQSHVNQGEGVSEFNPRGFNGKTSNVQEWPGLRKFEAEKSYINELNKYNSVPTEKRSSYTEQKPLYQPFKNISSVSQSQNYEEFIGKPLQRTNSTQSKGNLINQYQSYQPQYEYPTQFNQSNNPPTTYLYERGRE